ncbi:MAG: phage tail protein, partial [Citrobacter sp.]
MEKKYPVAVRGAGGGGGGGHTPSEASDTLRSRQIAVIVDALCEGPIEGLVGGAKGIYLDDSPLINFDGTQNYSTVAAQWRNGVQNQTPLDGFNDVEAETLVNTEVKFGVPVTRSLSDPTFSTIRVTVSVPALTEQKDNGDLVGSSVTLEIYIQKDNAGFPTTPAYTDTITGKTVANYRRSYIIALPASVTGTWGVRVVRKTPDSSNIKIQNRLIFESFTGIIDTQLSYPNTALVGIKFDSTQFNAIPTRSFRIKGLIVRVPSNYTPAFRDAITGTWTAARYDGLWDGTFKVLWTNNPAWCFYDLVTNERYGLGQFMDASSVDKWSLYNIAQYCDDMVPTGLGSQYEPRFTCNLFLQTREDAYKVVQNFASIFRAITYWGASSIIAMQDAPRDPIALFTNANVIEGDFNYTGSSIKQRHTAALVTWNDPDDMYRQKVEYVQDDEGIRELGVIDTSVVAFGCSSRGQAHRMGKWMLTTERLATEGISFKTGMDAATLYPGAIIITSDINRAQVRMGGRVVAISPTSITLDADFTIDDGQSYAIRVTGLEDATASNTENVSPKIHYLNIPAGAGVYREIPIGRDITGVVGKNAVFIIVASDVAPETWRVLNVKEAGDGILEVGAIAHIPGLYDLVERDVQFVAPPVSNVNTIPPAPTNFTAVNSNYLVDGDTVGLKVTLSWSGKGARYRVGWRRAGGIWQTRIVEEVTMDIGNVDYALYNFYVVAISAIGRESNAATLNQDLQSVATDLPIVTGLRLEAPFTASSAKYAWDATKGATSYEVKVKVGTPSRVARIVTVGDTLRFEYTAEDMRLDGGPWRNVILEVTALGKFGARSPSPAVLAAGNPQIGALNGIQIDPGFGTIFVKYARPETDDFAGILAWVGLTADFLPSADSLVFDGSDMLIVLRAMKDGTPFVGAREYFVRVAGYDDFGRDELTISNSFSVTPLATALGPESITAEMLKDGILTTAKFAADIEPVKIVGTVPTEKLTNTVFNQADGKIYTWDAATGKYSTQSFDLGDLTGVLKDAQIESIAASKVTGQMRNDQIAQLDAAKLIGQVIGSQIADGALNAAKFASGIQPVTNYAGVPTSFVTTTIYNTNNGQLYRWNGSDYVSTNDLSQMTGVLTEANIASVNASKITGQLTDNQILQLSAAKLLGQITGAQIVDAALTATKFASNIQPVTMYDGVPSAYVTTTVFNTRTNQLLRWNGMIYKATDDLGQMQGQLVAGQIASVEASKITGQMTNDQLQSIAAGKVAGQLVSAQIASVDGNKITGLLTQAQIEAAKVTGQLVSGQIQSGAILSDKIAAGAVRTENIAAGAITAQLLAIGDFENLVNCGIGMAITGFSAGMVPDASYPVFNTTYWNPLGESSAYQLAWVGRDNYYGSLFPVKPGDEYYCSMLTIPYGGISNLYNTQLGLRFHDSAGNIIGYDLAAIRYSGTVAAVKTEGIAKVPAAAVTAIVYFLIDGPANASWSAPGVGVHLAGIQVRRRNGGQLIVDGSITANKIAANSIDASKIQAGAITAGKIAAGSITSAELSIGVNGNLIRYSTFPISSRGWAIYSNAPGIELIKYADAAFTYNNEVLTAHSPGTPSPDNYCSIYQPERVPVQAGKWYEYSAYVNTHRCGVTLYIEWYTAYGQIISNNQSAYQGQIGKLGNDLNNYSRLFLNVQAPAGATGAIVYLLMKFTGETDPYLFFLRLYMAESTQHVTTPSAWAPMGVTQIDGQIITTRTIAAEQIVAETITATEIAASAITADKIAANSITAAKIQAGAIETAKIAAGAITAITIAAGTITGDKIAASTITADKLVANSITAGQIAAGAITSEQIA